jgi:hypothetical protein
MKLVAFLREGLYPAGFTKDQKNSFRRRANHFTVLVMICALKAIMYC